MRIQTEVDRIGATSMTFQQSVYLNDTETPVCMAKVTFVILDKQTGRPKPIEGELKQVLSKEISI